MANNATNKIQRKTFGLVLKDGVEVKTLEDLRENFDLEKAVEYFKSGELLEWLEDRFYDDEAEKIENISPNDKNLSQKICAALDVECDEDVEFIQRVREKKKILAEKTDDENIIDNATTTALNQDDLANLLHLDYSTIYLCGENFTVPIRVENKKYIGVLSTPKIKIRANSDAELAAKNIIFENCKLAWRKESPIDELKALVQKIFGNNGEFPIVDKNINLDKTRKKSYSQLSKTEKSLALRMVCQGKYTENQIVYMELNPDLTDGFALTDDALCTGGKTGVNVIKYNKIGSISCDDYLKIYDNDGMHYFWKKTFFYNKKSLNKKIKDFLEVVKNF